MELRAYIEFLKKWIWLIAVVTICSAATAAIISFFLMDKTYESSAMILISRPKLESKNASTLYNDILPDANLIKVYNRLGQSDAVMDQIAEGLKLDRSLDDLRTHIDIDTDKETGIIKASARSNQAQQAQEIVNLLVKSMQNQAIKIGLVDNMHIIDAARLPESPVSPKPVLNMIIAIVAGIFCGIILAVFLDSLDNSITNIKTLKELTKLPVLGIIPYLRVRKDKKSRGDSCSGTYTEKDEIFRILRTNVLHMCVNNSAKVLLIASPGASEGKTTIAASLAVSVRQLGRNVLLIDGNLRNPALHGFFKMGCTEGLNNYLSGGDEAKISTCTEADNNLHIITGGCTNYNSADLLSSPKLNSLLESMKERYDMIIIDSPSSLKYADTTIISGVVDGILLVADYGRTTYDMVEKAKEAMCCVNGKILGLVVNKFSR